MATAPKKKHPLDILAEADPREIIALMLWKHRHREPDMYVQITEADIEALRASAVYQKCTPAVMIKRPQGEPATPGYPASRGRPAIPARAATPAKDYVIVTLVDKGTENVIRSIENNERDYDYAKEVAAQRKARDDAPRFADLLMRMANGGDTSASDMTDAAECLRLLARQL